MKILKKKRVTGIRKKNELYEKNISIYCYILLLKKIKSELYTLFKALKYVPFGTHTQVWKTMQVVISYHFLF